MDDEIRKWETDSNYDKEAYEFAEAVIRKDDMTAKQMYAQLKERLSPDGKTYLFLDEVQEIKGWEKVVNSLSSDFDVDLYITGSNSRMMSSEISTYLTGRYISFRIFTLSFGEYLMFKEKYATISAKSIADYLKSQRRALDNETVYSYLEKLEKAYLLHRCSRYDLQGKEILKTQEKFYLADVSLRYSVLGYNADSVASSLENIVYLELCRRGYTVNIGKTSDGEIDFVAVRQNEKIYVQATQEIRSEKTEKREYNRLLEIHDNYPKYVLTTDEFAGGNYEGIKTMHIADFLLSSEY